MYKVVLNCCYGGFSLSREASEYLNEKYGLGINPKYGYIFDVLERHDKRLIEVVELLGEERASGDCARLRVVEIGTPFYRVDEYDGYESVETPSDMNWVSIENN